MWGFWLIASGIFFVLEIFTAGFLIFWLGIAGLLAMIVSFFTASIVVQTIVFVIASCLLIIFTRPIINKFLKFDKTETVPTNVYRLIGKTGIVIDEISPINGTGKIKVSGEYWSATSNLDIPTDTKVTVVSVDGVKLIVEPINTD